MMQRPAARLFAVLLCAYGLIATRSVQAQAASSSAYGASAGVVVKPIIGLQVSATVGPLPSASGSAPPTYLHNDTVASASLSTILTGQILQTGVLTAHADGQTGVAPAAQGRATVDGLGVNVPLLLGLTADTVESTASIDVVNGVVTPHGSTIITNPHLSGILGTGLSISATPAPNTVVLDVLGLKLVLNEQIVSSSAGNASISVNAIHLTLLNLGLAGIGQITGDIVIGHSEASLSGIASQVSVSQSASPSSVVANGTTVYSIVISNAGPLTANVTSVQEVLPASFSFVSSSAGTPTIAGNQLTFATPFTVLPGTSQTITITANVGTTLGTFTSNATVVGSNFPTATTGPAAPVTVTAPVLNGTISGAAQDSVTGAIIAGATVTLRDGNGQVIATTTTDANGTYTLANVPPGSFTVTFTAPGYAPTTQPATITSGSAATVNGSLDPLPGTMQGTILDGNTGLPLGGATVTITFNGTTLTTTTDSSGHYSFPTVPSEVPVTLTVTHPNYVPLPPITVTLPPNGDDTRIISLTPLPGTINGTILDGATQQPLPGATVRLLDSHGQQVGIATTDAQGHYSFPNLVPGTYTLQLSAPGYAPATVTQAVGPNQTVTRVDALTANPGTISGTVTDAITGLPIAGATVTLTQGAVTQTATTDAAGHYTLTNVIPDVAGTLTGSATNYQTSTPVTVTVGPGGSTTQNLQLQPMPGSISGQVTDSSTHAPIAGALAELLHNGTPVGSATTNAGGNYTLSTVTPGSYTVRFSATGYNTLTLAVSVAANQAQTLDAALVATGGGGSDTNGTITGTVTDASTGTAITGATVTLNDNGALRTATSDAGGHYSFSSVHTGVALQLRAAANGYQTGSPVTVTLPQNGSATVDLTLQPLPGAIQGTVTGTGNAPLSGVQVQLLDSDSHVVATTSTDGAGHYSFVNLTPGSYTLQFTLAGYLPATDTAIVPRNATVVVNAQLVAREGSVSGIVRDAENGSPIAGAQVTLRQGAASSVTITDTAGNYGFDNVTPGVSSTLEAEHADYVALTTTSFAPVAGVAERHDLALEPKPGSLGGTVVNATNNLPLPNVTVEVRTEDDVLLFSTSTNTFGAYSFATLPRGVYHLRFHLTGFGAGVAAASILANRHTTLDMALLPDDGSGGPVDPNGCINNPPILSVPATIAVRPIDVVSFQVAATDEDAVTLSVDNLPPCATFDSLTGMFTMSGSEACWADEQQVVVTFRAVDPRGAITSAPVWLIKSADSTIRRRAVGSGRNPELPIIARPPQPVVLSLGELVEIPLTGTSSTADCATTLDVTAPSSTTFNAGRGILTFAPRVAEAGESETVIVHATDCRGMSAFSSFVLVTRGSVEGGKLAVPASELSFGSVTADTLSEPVAFTLRNTGGTDLAVDSIQLSSDRFLVEGALGLPVVIPPGQSIEAAVRFLPSQAGPVNATLSVVSSDPDAPIKSIALSGQGIATSADADSPILWDDPNSSVVLFVPGTQLVERGQTLRFAVDALDRRGGAIRVSAQLPPGAKFENGIFTFDAPDICETESTEHVATFRATTIDGVTATATVPIRVVASAGPASDRAPVISVPAEAITIAPGETMSIPLLAAAETADCAVTFASSDSGFGSVNSAGTVWTFSPSAADLGHVFTVEVQATDCNRHQSSAAFELGVSNDDAIVRQKGVHVPQHVTLSTSAEGSVLTLPVVNDSDTVRSITSITLHDGRTLVLHGSIRMPFNLAPGQALSLPLAVKHGTLVPDRLTVTTSDPTQPSVVTAIDVQ